MGWNKSLPPSLHSQGAAAGALAQAPRFLELAGPLEARRADGHAPGHLFGVPRFGVVGHQNLDLGKGGYRRA